MGPFVDTLHPLIKAGEVDETPLDLFQRVFLEPLRDFLSWSPGSIAVLIPSLRDLISTHAVYPQAEFRRTVIKSDPVCNTFLSLVIIGCSYGLFAADSTCSQSLCVLS